MAIIYVHTPNTRGQQNNENMLQSNSLAADVFLFMAGGMHLAVSVGISFINNGFQFQYSWFVGVIVGAIVAATLTTLLPKRYYLFISSTLVIVSSILLIAAPSKISALLAARYIAGIGNGFLTIPFIMHSSEIASKSYRGFCVSMEQVGLGLGITLQSDYTGPWTTDTTTTFSPNCLLGIFCLIFGAIALALTFCSIESPVFRIRQGNDAAALDSLTRLQRPQVLNNAKKLWLEHLKAYVNDNEKMSLLECCFEGALPVVKMLLYRSVLALSFALPLTIALVISEASSLDAMVNWPMIVYGLLRFIGVAVAWYLLDAVGRKLCSLGALLLMAGCTIAVGGLFSGQLNDERMAAVCVLLLLLQLFAGIYAPSTTVYLSEAFPLQIKPYCIAFCVSVQYIVHIVVICTFQYSFHNIYVYCLAAGVIMFAGFVVFSITMPETRNTTLAEAQERFRKLLHFKCF